MWFRLTSGSYILSGPSIASSDFMHLCMLNNLHTCILTLHSTLVHFSVICLALAFTAFAFFPFSSITAYSRVPRICTLSLSFSLCICIPPFACASSSVRMSLSIPWLKVMLVPYSTCCPSLEVKVPVRCCKPIDLLTRRQEEEKTDTKRTEREKVTFFGFCNFKDEGEVKGAEREPRRRGILSENKLTGQYLHCLRWINNGEDRSHC